MYKRILFPVNDDGTLEAALPVVAAYARRGLGEVRVLHAHRAQGTQDESGWHLVGSVVNRLREAGANAVGETLQLHRGETAGATIAKVAARTGADLVVVGSHGRSDLGALFMGSVGDAVAAGLDIPVLIVRGTTEAAKPGTIIAGIDGSLAAEDAAAEAAELAEAFGARLVLLHVQQLLAAEGAGIMETEEEGRALLHRALERARRPGLEIVCSLTVDRSIAEALAAVACETHAGLVVLGSRRPSPLNGLLLGSVAHRLVHRTHLPVLLAGRARKPEPVG